MLAFPERNYDMSDSELWTKVSEVVSSMARDEAEFIVRGVTAADRTAFEAEGDAFEVLLPDSYYVGRITSAVAEKNAAKGDTEKLVQTVSGFVQQKWGLGSGEYKSLGIKGYSSMREGQQITAARQVATIAEDMLADLTPIGLTQAKIDELRAAAQAYEEGRVEVSDREKVRDNKARERVGAGNSLYGLLAKYCEIGKLIWENENPAYYSDYVIYPAVHSGLSKVQGLTAVVGGPGAADLEWEPVVGATEYEVEQAQSTTGQPQGEWQPLTVAPGTTASGPLQPGFTYWYRVRARNASQTGDWSDEATLDGV